MRRSAWPAWPGLPGSRAPGLLPSPAAAKPDMYLDRNGDVIPNASTRGHSAVAVPGTVAGLELARAKYGTQRRDALIAPAIALAEQGFTLDAGDAERVAKAIANPVRQSNKVISVT